MHTLKHISCQYWKLLSPAKRVSVHFLKQSCNACISSEKLYVLAPSSVWIFPVFKSNIFISLPKSNIFKRVEKNPAMVKFLKWIISGKNCNWWHFCQHIQQISSICKIDCHLSIVHTCVIISDLGTDSLKQAFSHSIHTHTQSCSSLFNVTLTAIVRHRLTFF